MPGTLRNAIASSSCDASTLSVATCGPNHTDNWQWSSEALRCGAHRLSAQELRGALSKRWIVVAGDSVARFFFAAMLRLLSDDGQRPSGHPSSSPIILVPLLPSGTMWVVHMYRIICHCMDFLTAMHAVQISSRWCMGTETLSSCCPMTSGQPSFGRLMQPI